jgi:P-type E1-E2 ATPase
MKAGSESDALAAAYAMEKNAVHPIAKAILTYAESQKTPVIPIKNFRALPGYGVEAIIPSPQGEKKAYIGRPEYIQSNLDEKQVQLLLEKTQEIKEHGELLATLLMDGQVFLFRFRDTPRPKIKEMIEAIEQRNWRVIMLTGDHEQTARRIADEVGIKEYYANLTPEDKLHYVTKIAQEDGLAVIGDGVNDAPALARATVGICMGKVGSTAAIDAADVVLLHDNIELLDWLVGKAYKTQAIVKQNLLVASAAILFASLPALAGLVPLWLAVVMHEGGTVLVGLNALRLLHK